MNLQWTCDLKYRKDNSMPCVFNIKTEDRDCRFCTATICDERQPKQVETFANNKIKQYGRQREN